MAATLPWPAFGNVPALRARAGYRLITGQSRDSMMAMVLNMTRIALIVGIGTLFSMALLSVATSIVMELTARVASALWATQFINALTGNNSEGLSNQAMEQGGVGLLMTVLIISVPPMASMFFQGTLGQFYFSSAFGMGAARGQALANGLPANAYGHGGYGPSQASIGQASPGQLNGAGGFNTLPGSGSVSANGTRFGKAGYEQIADVTKQGGGLANPTTPGGTR